MLVTRNSCVAFALATSLSFNVACKKDSASSTKTDTTSEVASPKPRVPNAADIAFFTAGMFVALGIHTAKLADYGFRRLVYGKPDKATIEFAKSIVGEYLVVDDPNAVNCPKLPGSKFGFDA